MTNLVVSQPMFFPWVGLFEQIRLADIFVHYDDVQFPQGRSFIARVQVKMPQGMHWLTVPTFHKSNTLIKDIRIDNSQKWKEKHKKTFQRCYAKAPFFEEMYALVEDVYNPPSDFLSDLNIRGIEITARYFDLKPRFMISSGFGTTTHSTQKLVDIARLLGAQRYITGLGALKYLEHEKFEAQNIKVEYMKYEKTPYPQVHGAFTPYVSIMDLIANCGREGIRFIHSTSIGWKEFTQHEQT